jgi:hypothetical protein
MKQAVRWQRFGWGVALLSILLVAPYLFLLLVEAFSDRAVP